ncbi:hypothetical protein [Vibrio splendidus]|uniref:hypothetical protein n=1 Tax=Vibrio splendidus TaxID=29497 RepID=UPI0018E47A04|nr:hypothetical protein [Vibrio splendidus]
MSQIVSPLVRNVCSGIFIRSKTAMRVYLIVFMPNYEGIRKSKALTVLIGGTLEELFKKSNEFYEIIYPKNAFSNFKWFIVPRLLMILIGWTLISAYFFVSTEPEQVTYLYDPFFRMYVSGLIVSTLLYQVCKKRWVKHLNEKVESLSYIDLNDQESYYRPFRRALSHIYSKKDPSEFHELLKINNEKIELWNKYRYSSGLGFLEVLGVVRKLWVWVAVACAGVYLKANFNDLVHYQVNMLAFITAIITVFVVFFAFLFEILPFFVRIISLTQNNKQDINRVKMLMYYLACSSL